MSRGTDYFSHWNAMLICESMFPLGLRAEESLAGKLLDDGFAAAGLHRVHGFLAALGEGDVGPLAVVLEHDVYAEGC